MRLINTITISYIHNGQWCTIYHINYKCVCHSNTMAEVEVSERIRPNLYTYRFPCISLLRAPPKRNKQRISYVLLIEWLNDSKSTQRTSTQQILGLFFPRSAAELFHLAFVFVSFEWKQLTLFISERVALSLSFILVDSTIDTIVLSRFVCLFYTHILFIYSLFPSFCYFYLLLLV